MKQFIKFGMVGVTNTLLSYFLNIATLYLLRDKGLSYDYMIANVVAFLISVLWSFYYSIQRPEHQDEMYLTRDSREGYAEEKFGERIATPVTSVTGSQ